MRACALKAISDLPDKERKSLSDSLSETKPALDYAAVTKEALAGKHDPISSLAPIVERAVREGDRARAVELVELMERAAKNRPPAGDDYWRREILLAQANALAGREQHARAHVDAARKKLPASDQLVAAGVHGDVMVTALMLGDQAMADAAEAAFFRAYERSSDPDDVAMTVLLIANAGFGRRVLSWVPKGSPDGVARIIANAAAEKQDLPLALEALEKLSPRARLLQLEQLWLRLSDADKFSGGFVAAAKATAAVERAAGVDGPARVQLVTVLSDLGLAAEARAIAPRIANPWERAEAEARIAWGLAASNPKEAVTLARAALKRAATPGMRTDEDSDRDARDRARSEAANALARAGKLADAMKIEMPNVVDIAFGMRDKPADLAKWWKTLSPSYRAHLLVVAARNHYHLGDPQFLEALCQ